MDRTVPVRGSIRDYAAALAVRDPHGTVGVGDPGRCATGPDLLHAAGRRIHARDGTARIADPDAARADGDPTW